MKEKEGSEACKPTKGIGINSVKPVRIDDIPLFKKEWHQNKSNKKEAEETAQPIRSWADISPDYWNKQLEERAKRVVEQNLVKQLNPKKRIFTKEELEDNRQTAERGREAALPDIYFIDDDEETFLPEDDIDEPSLESILFSEGSRIEDYQIGEQIGAGGMGGIFSLRKHNKDYILKIPLRLGSQKTALENEITALKYTWNEVRRGIATGTLPSEPNIIKLHASSQGYLTWAILELLEGSLDCKKPISETAIKRPIIVAKKDTIKGQQPGRVARYILDVAQTLEFLHSLNVVHGDVKYQNCMETHRNGNLEFILFDFGLAKILNEANERRIRKIERFGMTLQYVTKSYLNEMMMGWDGRFYQKCSLPKMRLILKRSDWEALAFSAYELLTGVSPYSYTAKPRRQDGYECPLNDSSSYARIKTILEWSGSPLDYNIVRKCSHGDTFVKVFQLLQDPFMLSKDNLKSLYRLLKKDVLAID